MTGRGTDYSIVIPAFNEESLIAETLRSVSSAMARVSPRGEVIVVDNNSSDNTAEIARDCGARVVFEAKNQISRARNCGAAASTGDFLIFLDADTHMSAELLQVAISNLQSGCCVGGGVVVCGDRQAPPRVQRAIDHWNALSLRFSIAAGCFVYCLRESFEEVGGFSERVYASEEIWLSRALKRVARRRGMIFTIIEAPAVVTSLRKLEWYSKPQLLLRMAVLLFPFALFSKTLCGFWYQRW